jgi:cytochrome P450
MDRQRQPFDTAEDRAERTIGHFRWMLYFMVGGFLVTEILAWTGIVPHLRPVSLQEVTANILFAIGFGCPLVLYLSSLPRWRECLGTFVAGLLLALVFWRIQLWFGLPPALKAGEVGVAQAIVGLGLASLGTMARRAWSGSEPVRSEALLYLLPACVALVYTLEAGIFLYFIKDLYPITEDAATYIADATYGIQLSFATGRLFAALPLLKLVCFAIYVAPPPALVFVYALQTRARRPPPVDVITVLLFMALTGYTFYFLFPVCGPLFAFGDAFPNAPPPASEFLGKRLTITDKDAWPNGMPSLHLASVILAYWHARPYGRWARAVAAVFVFGTVLATLGMGEHYFVDLVVALPFTLALHAACMPRWKNLRRARRDAFLGCAALVALWYLILFLGIPFLQIAPLIPWSLTLGTLAAVVWLERRLYRATLAPVPEVIAPKIAPGPRGRFLIGNLLEFRKDVLQLLLDGRHEFGDVVRFRLGPMIVHLVNHPDYIRHVLLSRHDIYNKDTRSSAKIRSITGEGLLTSNGEFWLHQRRLMQPTFSPQRLTRFVGVMTQATGQMLQRWAKWAEEGRSLDVASEMMTLTFTIVGKALFGAELGGDAETVEQASTEILEHTWRRLEKLIELPEWFPSRRNRCFRRSLHALDQIVHRLITQRRRSGEAANDLLTLLLKRCDEETGQRMSDEQLRNETLTLLLAGHETTANALSWTWYLLSKHPAVQRRLAEEIAEVLGGRIPSEEDLPRLCYTAMVFKEAMRLYPPIWIMERRALAEDTIGGYTIPAGSSVVISPYVTHRDSRFWENPEGFDPDRFAPPNAETRDPHCYIPFGLGQRLCIGNHFASMEAQVVLAMTMQAFRLDLVARHPVEPNPGITLRLKKGLPMILRPPV